MTVRYRSFLGRAREDIERYVSSIEVDRSLAKYAAMVMLAHVENLRIQGLIPREGADKLASILKQVVLSSGRDIYEWIEKEGLTFEDVFEAMEAYLFDRAGDYAGYVALGRSRNDHVAAALRLLIRDYVVKLLTELLNLRRALLEKAVEYEDTLFVFFTHRQLAQCGSASIYFASYLHTFTVLWRQLLRALELLNENPLGSGPAAGSIVGFVPALASRALCFREVATPPYYATGSRLFALYPLSIMTLIAAEVSRFAEDMIFLNSLVPNGVKPPVEHVATSSIMPHKKNLVTLEIVRAKASEILGSLVSVVSLYKSLPYGYSLELQEVNSVFIDAANEAIDTLRILTDFVKGLKIDEGELRKLIQGKPCWSSELVEHLAIEKRRPARETYFHIAKLLRDRMELGGDVDEVLSMHGLDLEDLVKEKPIEGYMKKLLESHRGLLEADGVQVEKIAELFDRCTAELLSKR